MIPVQIKHFQRLFLTKKWRPVTLWGREMTDMQSNAETSEHQLQSLAKNIQSNGQQFKSQVYFTVRRADNFCAIGLKTVFMGAEAGITLLHEPKAHPVQSMPWAETLVPLHLHSTQICGALLLH